MRTTDAQVRKLMEEMAKHGRLGLASHLGTLVGRSRRMAFRLVLEGSEALARPLVESGLDDPDPVVRGVSAGRVEAFFSGEDLLRLLARMERSRSMVVRREAYVTYARRVPELGEAKVREALLDPVVCAPSTSPWACSPPSSPRRPVGRRDGGPLHREGRHRRFQPRGGAEDG